MYNKQHTTHDNPTNHDTATCGVRSAAPKTPPHHTLRHHHEPRVYSTAVAAAVVIRSYCLLYHIHVTQTHAHTGILDSLLLTRALCGGRRSSHAQAHCGLLRRHRTCCRGRPLCLRPCLRPCRRHRGHPPCGVPCRLQHLRCSWLVPGQGWTSSWAWPWWWW